VGDRQNRLEKVEDFLMSSIPRAFRLFLRLLKGEDIFIAERTPRDWDAQYKRGKWDYLLEEIPSNAKRLVEMIGEMPIPRRVLDVGCGNGGLYFALKQKGAAVDYVGIDYSSEAILQAKATFPEATFFVGDATAPKEEWGKDFSVIVFNEVLYYVPALATLEKYDPLLMKGGKHVVSMYRAWRTRTLGILLRYKKHATIEHLPLEANSPAFIIATIG
jgi:SAM-dependent methyltransferase